MATATPTRAPEVQNPIVNAPNAGNAERQAEPPKFAVVLKNDNSTNIAFVVHVLVRVFGMESRKAFDFAIAVHMGGSGVISVYPKDVAETKHVQAQTMVALSQGQNQRNPNAPCELTFTVEQQ